MDENRIDGRKTNLVATGLFAIVFGVTVIVGCYVGSYCLLLDSTPNPYTGEVHEVAYRIPGPVPHYVFTPASSVDRWLRPDHWALVLELREFDEEEIPRRSLPTGR
jgi:hypothetical protein